MRWKAGRQRDGYRLLQPRVAVVWVQVPAYINNFYNTLDQAGLSGTQWGWTPAYNPITKDGWNQEDYSVVDQNLQIRSNYAIRPYTRAIAGIPGPFLVRRLARIGSRP